ncbi:MAG: hypothetical protein QW303_01045 [Nitrososphaerota archaeon]
MAEEPKLRVLQDPSSSLALSPTFTLQTGSKERTFQPYVSINNSISSTQWSIVPPDPNTIIRRMIWLAMPVRVTMSRAFGGPENILQYGETDAFAAYPLASCMTTAQVQFNNASIAYPVNSFFPYLMKFKKRYELEKGFYSTFPSYLDCSQSYEELVGTLENPLGGYPNNSLPGCFKRGQIPIVIISNTPTSAELVALLLEPLFLSPLEFEGDNVPGLYGIKNLNINITWDNLSKMWSKAFVSPANPVTVNVSIVGVSGLPSWMPNLPTLYLRYDTPFENLSLSVPYVTPYYQLDRYTTDFGSLAAGATISKANFQTIQSNSIPSRIYIFTRERDADISFEKPRVCSAIEGVEITFMNKANQLATATVYDLWKMSYDNGYMGSFSEWLGNPPGLGATTFGSILCLEFGKDIALESGYFAGREGTYQLQIKLTYRNPSSRPINYTGYVVLVYPGSFITVNGSCRVTLANMPAGALAKANLIGVKEYESSNFLGGIGLGDVKTAIGLAAKGVGALLPIIKPKLPPKWQQRAEKVGEFAKKFEGWGYGGQGTQLGEEMTENEYSGEGGEFMSLDDFT